MPNKGIGILFIVAAPSGAGKTSLVTALVASLPCMKVSISYTTRPQRLDEIEGVNYHFINESTYQRMKTDQAFLEHATVFGYHYGTAKAWVMEQLREGIDVVLEIDWQGAQQIRALFPSVVSIFIVPPSLSALRQRLIQRAQDNPEVIERRMAEAHTELAHYAEFDYLIVNEDFNLALRDLRHIVQAERLALSVQQVTHASLLAELLQTR